MITILTITIALIITIIRMIILKIITIIIKIIICKMKNNQEIQNSAITE